jgi:uncharacterized surface anchored protein
VWIDLDNDATKDSNEQSLLTDKNGRFVFTNLAAGTYTIRQVLPTGWIQSRPAPGMGFTVTVSNGQTVSAQNFTSYQSA